MSTRNSMFSVRFPTKNRRYWLRKTASAILMKDHRLFKTICNLAGTVARFLYLKNLFLRRSLLDADNILFMV